MVLHQTPVYINNRFTAVRDNFATSRIRPDQRGVSLSLLELVRALAKATADVVWSNYLFNPDAKGWEAGMPFRTAFAFVGFGDIMLIWLIYVIAPSAPRYAVDDEDGGGGGGIGH